jgi:O-antigen ligase
MAKFIRLLENAFAIGSLLLFSQGFFLLFLGTDLDSNPDVDNLFLRLIFQIIYLITFVLLLLRWNKTIQSVKGNWWIFILIGLAIISILWSSLPDITLRKVFALIGTTFFGIYLGTHYNFQERIKILSWVFGISIIFSFLFIFIIPTYGIMQSEALQGAWRGIYPHKNGLGESMVIAFITFYILSISRLGRKYKWIFRLASLLTAILIFFGKSATSLLSIVFTYAAIQVLKRLSIKSKKGVLLILTMLILGVILQIIFVVNFQEFLAVNNRDITLSGRTIMWSVLWDFIQKKPWLGYGYGAFFSADQTETQLLWQVIEWGPVHAHNGYIQICLNVGIIACLLFVIGYCYSLLKSLFLYLVSKDDKMLWTFSFLSYTIFFNFTEVSFLSINNVSWILALATIFSLNIENKKIIQ